MFRAAQQNNINRLSEEFQKSCVNSKKLSSWRDFAVLSPKHYLARDGRPVPSGGGDPRRVGIALVLTEKNYANSPALITLEVRLRRVFVLQFRTRIADPSIFHECTPYEKACSERRSVDASCDFQ